MRRLNINVIVAVFLTHLIIFSNLFIIIDNVVAEDIKPGYGVSPDINGKIDRDVKEWTNATKETINLFTNGSETDKGLPINLWVLENESTLYILVSFDLEDHQSTEFIGLMITESGKDGENEDDYVDAKIIQFTDIEEDDYYYRDYNINDGVFYIDSDKDGKGAARLKDDNVIYEFSLPINNTKAEEDKDDVFLDFGEEYAFKIVYGESSNYPDSINKSGVVIVSIVYPRPGPPRNWYVDFHNVLCIIVFIGTTALFGLYIYKIVLLNKKLERLQD